MERKWRKLIVIAGASAAVYVLIQYILPLVLPLVLGYLIARLLYPLAKRIADSRWYPKKLSPTVGFAVFLVIVVTAIGGFLCLFVQTGWKQLQLLLVNWDSYEARWVGIFSDFCGQIDRFANLSIGTTYHYCCDQMEQFFANNRSVFPQKVLQLSIPTVKVFGEFAAFLFTAIFSSLFFMTERYESEKKGENKRYFFSEFRVLGARLKEVFGAYFKAQGIIILATIAISAAGLMAIRNPYSLLLACVIGLLDALPFIGTGLFYIPWIAVTFLLGNGRQGAVLLVTYLACYFSREFLEPKLMGKHAGISPLVTLAAVYVGYQVFGLLGVIYGPIAYVLIVELARLWEEETKKPLDKQEGVD